jgi:hypothetical protein
MWSMPKFLLGGGTHPTRATNLRHWKLLGKSWMETLQGDKVGELVQVTGDEEKNEPLQGSE